LLVEESVQLLLSFLFYGGLKTITVMWRCE